MTVVLKTTSCCGLIDHATECARLRLCLLVDTVTPRTAVARQHEATVPTAQGCFFLIKVTLHIYSFLLTLLFIHHLVSRETDEGPFTLSEALHTSGFTRAHTRTHLKVMEGDV